MMDCSVDTWVLATTKQEESDNISLVKSCTFVIFCSLPILGLDASEVLWRTGPEAAGVQGHRQIKSYYITIVQHSSIQAINWPDRSANRCRGLVSNPLINRMHKCII